ncbi:unnamed protein product [Vicia faba]|uniref:Uncharacterized protein n=1 Tax=Vicia faba TaxID=3906 RepID=A0AAV1AEL0_VICFA|nr:unnamed protein product [Vicia faba]
MMIEGYSKKIQRRQQLTMKIWKRGRIHNFGDSSAEIEELKRIGEERWRLKRERIFEILVVILQAVKNPDESAGLSHLESSLVQAWNDFDNCMQGWLSLTVSSVLNRFLL